LEFVCELWVHGDGGALFMMQSWRLRMVLAVAARLGLLVGVAGEDTYEDKQTTRRQSGASAQADPHPGVGRTGANLDDKKLR
jgi:hypothetical protein